MVAPFSHAFNNGQAPELPGVKRVIQTDGWDRKHTVRKCRGIPSPDFSVCVQKARTLEASVGQRVLRRVEVTGEQERQTGSASVLLDPLVLSSPNR